MSLSKAIQTKDKTLLKQVVADARAIYKAKKPKEPQVETCNGPMDISMAVSIDKKAFWVLAVQAYTEIVNTPISKKADKQVEIAKLIATNAILRSITKDPKDNGGLL